MKEFKFFYEGWPNQKDSDQMTTGIKLMEGAPVDIGRCLGVYADAQIKLHRSYAAAMIIVNAYQEFKKLNPDLTTSIENQLAGETGGIVKPIFKP